jgi:hypothetical protein
MHSSFQAFAKLFPQSNWQESWMIEQYLVNLGKKVRYLGWRAFKINFGVWIQSCEYWRQVGLSRPGIGGHHEYLFSTAMNILYLPRKNTMFPPLNFLIWLKMFSLGISVYAKKASSLSEITPSQPPPTFGGGVNWDWHWNLARQEDWMYSLTTWTPSRPSKRAINVKLCLRRRELSVENFAAELLCGHWWEEGKLFVRRVTASVNSSREPSFKTWSTYFGSFHDMIDLSRDSQLLNVFLCKCPFWYSMLESVLVLKI